MIINRLKIEEMLQLFMMNKRKIVETPVDLMRDLL